MGNQYLDWLDDSVLEANVQYLLNRIQPLNMNKHIELRNRVSQIIQEEVLPTLNYADVLMFDRLERSLPLFHTHILRFLPGWEAEGNLDGLIIDLMNTQKNIYVEFKRYFRYQYGTTYIDRLAKYAHKYQDKQFYLVFTSGILENDVLPARDRIELAYPELENLLVVEIDELYAQVTGQTNAMQQIISILPKVFRKVISNPIPIVFISYSRQNTAEMKQVQTALSKNGIVVWTDELLQPGTPDWQIAIEQSLENAACVLLILSADAKKSEWVRNELNYAREVEIPIIPFWISGEGHEVSMLNLITTQRIDARTPEIFDTAIDHAIQSIETYIRQKLTKAT